MKTIKEVIVDLYQKVIAQGVPSYKPESEGRPGVCMYRGPNGTKCAVGMLIPDGHPALSYENTNIRAMYFDHKDSGIGGLVADLVGNDNVNDAIHHLRELQFAHDEAAFDSVNHGGDFVGRFRNNAHLRLPLYFDEYGPRP